MSNYSKLTDFAAKDSLNTGNPSKIVKGTEIDDELTAISGAVASKADTANPTFTGTITAANLTLSTDLTVSGATSLQGTTVTSLTTTGSVVFEGSTADAYETTLAVTDPTADRTITFPNKTGTVALTSDISSATIASGTGTYAISGSSTLTVTLTSHGRAVGEVVYLGFTSGTATSGEFTVATVTDTDNFTVDYGSTLTTSGNVSASYSNLGLTRIASLSQTLQGTSTDTFVSPYTFRQSKLISGTSVSASGTSVDFTGIPSWVKRITVMFGGVSTSGSSQYLIRLGTSGGFVSSNYTSMCGRTGTDTAASSSSTAGFNLYISSGSHTHSGSVQLTNLTGNSWTSSGNVSYGSGVMYTAGQITGDNLGGTLNSIRITTVNGTDTFDAGTINIMYE